MRLNKVSHDKEVCFNSECLISIPIDEIIYFHIFEHRKILH